MPLRPDITTVAKPTPIRRWQSVLTFFILTAAALWCVFHVVHRDQSIYNPGHVTLVHKNFEQQCWRCHDGGENGAFSEKVSDTACLKCHDGSIHSPNQKFSDGHSHVKLVVAVHNDPTHPQGMRSSDCISCHIEHRGHEALVSAGDVTCTQCHDNLQIHAVNKIVAPNSVTAFLIGKHPDFGRELIAGGLPRDPTVLKFDHKAHLANVPDIAQLAEKDRCILCHRTTESDKQYMQPVSYQTDCFHCHPVTLQAGTLTATLTHQDLKLVRRELQTLPALYLAQLSQLTPVAKMQALYKGSRKPRPGQKPETFYPSRPAADFYSDADFVQKQLDALSDRLNSLPSVRYPDRMDQLHKALGDAPPATTMPTTSGATFNVPNAELLENYLAFEASDNCIECHRMSGATSSVMTAIDAAATQPAATQPAMLVTLLTTDPVQMPRIFYPNSKFSHEAHKTQSCISCHANVAPDVSKGDYVDPYKPLRDSDPMKWDQLELDETSKLLTPTAITSCTQCHNPTGTTGRTASSSCVTCHDYHDRRLLRPGVVSASP